MPLSSTAHITAPGAHCVHSEWNPNPRIYMRICSLYAYHQDTNMQHFNLKGTLSVTLQVHLFLLETQIYSFVFKKLTQKDVECGFESK